MLRADALREAPTASPPPPPRETDPRRAGLRRMRLLATLLLVLMAAIFIVTTAVKLDWPWIPYVRAFAEAGMVGACADWFAIVALFRRPLGLPIPHTGIVPNNKDRIGKALGYFITNNVLTAAVMNERLARIDMVGALARWLSEPANAKRLGDYVALQLPHIAESLPLPRIDESIGTIAQQAAQAVPAAPVAAGCPWRSYGRKARRRRSWRRRSDRARRGSPATRTSSPTKSRSDRRAGSPNGSIG